VHGCQSGLRTPLSEIYPFQYIPFLTQSFNCRVDLAGSASLVPATKKTVPKVSSASIVFPSLPPLTRSSCRMSGVPGDREVRRRAGGTVVATVQVKMAKTPSDVNLRSPEWAMRYITDNMRKADVWGPVFLTVRAEIGEQSFFFETGHGIWGTRRHCANEKGEKPRLRITQTYLGSRFFVLQCKG